MSPFFRRTYRHGHPHSFGGWRGGECHLKKHERKQRRLDRHHHGMGHGGLRGRIRGLGRKRRAFESGSHPVAGGGREVFVGQGPLYIVAQMLGACLGPSWSGCNTNPTLTSPRTKTRSWRFIAPGRKSARRFQMLFPKSGHVRAGLCRAAYLQPQRRVGVARRIAGGPRGAGDWTFARRHDRLCHQSRP